MKIVIDAGHGPNTPGKRTPDGSMLEFEFNSAVAGYLREELSVYDDIETMFTHDASTDVPLSDRTDKANAWGADLFISIHANAVGSGWNDVTGIETYVYTTLPEDSVSIAKSVQESLVSSTGRIDRGVKSADFHVLRETTMPAILVECEFMTCKESAELLKSDSYRKLCAQAIARGIASHYSLSQSSEVIATKVSAKVGDVESDAYLVDGRVYVPTRVIADNFGISISWDNVNKIVYIDGGN